MIGDAAGARRRDPRYASGGVIRRPVLSGEKKVGDFLRNQRGFG